MNEPLELWFRPPGTGQESLQVPDGEGGWVEGAANVYYDEAEDCWHVGIYVWHGAVETAVRLEMEKRIGEPLHWETYGGGNGRESGVLARGSEGGVR